MRCFYNCLTLGIVTTEMIGVHPERGTKYKEYIDQNLIKFPEHLNIDVPPSHCEYNRQNE